MDRTSFYNELVSLKKVLGLSISDVARTLKLSPSTVSKWFIHVSRGRTAPKKSLRREYINKLSNDTLSKVKTPATQFVEDSLDVMFSYSVSFTGLNHRLSWAYKKGDTEECLRTMSLLALTLQTHLSYKGYPFTIRVSEDHQVTLTMESGVAEYTITFRRNKAMAYAELSALSKISGGQPRVLFKGHIGSCFADQLELYLN